jgi:hypothetical protein
VELVGAEHPVRHGLHEPLQPRGGGLEADGDAAVVRVLRLDLLQGGDELFPGGRRGGDAGLGESLLVGVDDAERPDRERDAPPLAHLDALGLGVLCQRLLVELVVDEAVLAHRLQVAAQPGVVDVLGQVGKESGAAPGEVVAGGMYLEEVGQVLRLGRGLHLGHVHVVRTVCLDLDRDARLPGEPFRDFL